METRQIKRINNKVSVAYHNQLSSFLTDQKNVTKLIAFLSSIGLTAAIGDSNMLFPIITGATGYAFTSSVLKAIRDTRDFSLEYKRQLIRDTDEYGKCIELYDSVVTDTANFIRSLGFKNSLDVGMFYQELLYNGFLSADGTFAYHKYSSDQGICPEMYGARISSGYGVCRHIATNLKDIYEKMGYTASYLSVGGAKGTLVSNIKTRIMPSSIHHAVVCVKDRFGKYIIDPTWEKVAVFDGDDKFAHIIGDTSEDRRYVIGYTTLIDRKRLLKYDSYVGVRNATSAHLVADDVIDSSLYAKNVFFARRRAIVEFYYYIKKRLESIKFYEQELSCCKDVTENSQKRLVKGA